MHYFHNNNICCWLGDTFETFDSLTMSYYYANASNSPMQREGPYEIEFLIEQFKNNQINEDTLIWTEGQQNWEPLKINKTGKFIIESVGKSTPVGDYDIDNDEEEDDDDLSTSEMKGTELYESDDVSVYDNDEDKMFDICEFSSGPPPPLKGLLLKVASGMIKNWRNRCFFLDKGTLIYCEPAHLKLRGRYNLIGLQIWSDHVTDTPETIRLYHPDRVDIVLIAPSLKLRKVWAAALTVHIRYAEYLVSNSSNGKAVEEAPSTMRSTVADNAYGYHLTRKMTVTVIEETGNGMAYFKDEAYTDNIENSSSSGKSQRSNTAYATDSNQQRPISPVARRSTLNAGYRPPSNTVFTGTEMTGRESIMSTITVDSFNTNNTSRKSEAMHRPSLPIQHLTGTGVVTAVNGTPTLLVASSQSIRSSLDMPYRHLANNTIEIPAVCEGWMQKQGQFFPSIRKRYFILDRGVLRYYKSNINDTSDEKNNTIRAHTPRGVVTIRHYDLYSDNSENIQLTLVPGPKSVDKRKLLMFCENFVDRDMWVSAINVHIAYYSGGAAPLLVPVSQQASNKRLSITSAN